MTEYTLVIPTNSLYLLKDWYPELKIQAIKGVGSIQGEKKQYEIRNGKFIIGSIVDKTNQEVNLNYYFTNGEIQLKNIYDIIKEETEVPDIKLEFIAYMEKNLKLGPGLPTSVRCDFNRHSIHPGIMKKMVLDGDYPLKEIHQIITTVNETIKQLPKEIKDRFSPSFLNLNTTPNIKDDGPAIQALHRAPMIFMEETQKLWNLSDLKYRKRGGTRL